MILIIGADGLLGSSLYQYLGSDRAFGTSRRPSSDFVQFDCSQSLSTLLSYFPAGIIDTVVICFAASDVGFCEANIQYSSLVNLTYTVSLVKEAEELGLFSIVFSSEYVFDGLSVDLYTEFHKRNPLTSYGQQKSRLEDYILNSTDMSVVLRVSKLSSLSNHKSFMSRMISTMRSSSIYHAAVDQIFTPISIYDAVRVIQYFASTQLSGIYNLCGYETFSRFQLAHYLSDQFDLSVDIRAVNLSDISSIYYMPPNLSMSSRNLSEILPFELQSLSESLAEFC